MDKKTVIAGFIVLAIGLAMMAVDYQIMSAAQSDGSSPRLIFVPYIRWSSLRLAGTIVIRYGARYEPAHY